MKIFQTTYLIVAGMILLLIFGCTAKKTHPEHHIGIEIHDAWVRTVPPNMTITTAYMTLHNHSNMEDALVSVETPVAGVVESHSVEEKNGVMSMKPVDSIPVQPHGMQELKPGGYHLMLIQLKEVPKIGDKVHMVLNFKHAGRTDVIVPVKEGSMKSMKHKGHGEHGGSMKHYHNNN